MVRNATTINGDVASKPLSGRQWYQKEPSGERIAPGNPKFFLTCLGGGHGRRRHGPRATKWVRDDQ
jgi:hypothetical protein